MLLQLGEFRSGFFEYRDVGVGVLPKGEQILVRAFCPGPVASQDVRLSEMEAGRRTETVPAQQKSVRALVGQCVLSGDLAARIDRPGLGAGTAGEINSSELGACAERFDVEPSAMPSASEYTVHFRCIMCLHF